MTRRAWQIVGTGVVAVMAIGLSVLALVRATSTPSADVARAVNMTVSSTPTPTSSTQPSATPPPTLPVPVSPTAQRFLSAYGNTVWRATAGACGRTRPIVDYSTDGGKTWKNVTPRDNSMNQIAAVDALNTATAAVVTGSGPACTPTALRTFTAGAAWETAPATLAIEHYVDLTDPAHVVIPGGTITAPCTAPQGLRATSTAMALICNGTAYVRTGTQWSALPPAHAAAVAITQRGVIVASTASSACDGVALTRFPAGASAGAAAGCAAGVSTSGAIAIAPAGSGMLVWAGNTVVDAPST